MKLSGLIITYEVIHLTISEDHRQQIIPLVSPAPSKQNMAICGFQPFAASSKFAVGLKHFVVCGANAPLQPSSAEAQAR